MTIESARLGGTLTRWNDGRGFGFITPALGYDDVFVHISAFPAALHRPELGEEITFAIERDGHGRERAHDIRYLRPSQTRVRRGTPVPIEFRRPRATSVLALIALGAAIAVAAGRGVPPAWLGWGYAVASVVCFAAYTRDKAAATRGGWRVAEATLHCLGIVGGWPGAVIAQELLRHKTQKRSFRSTFWFTVVVNLAALALVASPWGRPALAAMIDVQALLSSVVHRLLAGLA